LSSRGPLPTAIPFVLGEPSKVTNHSHVCQSFFRDSSALATRVGEFQIVEPGKGLAVTLGLASVGRTLQAYGRSRPLSIPCSLMADVAHSGTKKFAPVWLEQIIRSGPPEP